jgi:hypothetical protein
LADSQIGRGYVARLLGLVARRLRSNAAGCAGLRVNGLAAELLTTHVLHVVVALYEFAGQRSPNLQADLLCIAKNQPAEWQRWVITGIPLPPPIVRFLQLRT